MLYKKKRLYIIVGEESGENIAFSILKSLNNYCELKLFGIGGERLKSLGLKSLFPFSEYSGSTMISKLIITAIIMCIIIIFY